MERQEKKVRRSMSADEETSTDITATTEESDGDEVFKCPSATVELCDVVSAMPHSDMRFPQKAFHIITLSDKSSPHVACWSVEGDAIVIKDKAQLEKKYLSISFESFVRQLHIYGFRKANIKRGGNDNCINGNFSRELNNKKELIFRHEDFRKDRSDLLSKIQITKKDDKVKAKLNKQKELENGAENNARLDFESTTITSAALHERLDRLEGKVDNVFAKIDELATKVEKMLLIMLNTSSDAKVTDSSLEENSNLVHKRPRQERCFGSNCTMIEQQDKSVVTVSPLVSSKDIIDDAINLAPPPIHVARQQSLGQQQHGSFQFNPSTFATPHHKAAFYDPHSGQPQYGDVFEGGIDDDDFVEAGSMVDLEKSSESSLLSEQHHLTDLANSHCNHERSHRYSFDEVQLAQLVGMDLGSSENLSVQWKTPGAVPRRKSFLLFSALALMAVVAGVGTSVVINARGKEGDDPLSSFSGESDEGSMNVIDGGGGGKGGDNFNKKEDYGNDDGENSGSGGGGNNDDTTTVSDETGGETPNDEYSSTVTMKMSPTVSPYPTSTPYPTLSDPMNSTFGSNNVTTGLNGTITNSGAATSMPSGAIVKPLSPNGLLPLVSSSPSESPTLSSIDSRGPSGSPTISKLPTTAVSSPSVSPT